MQYIQIMQQTSQQWQESTHTVSRLTDKLGRGLDPGIRDTVIALNALGIHTAQSCEGHLDHGRPYPWVTIHSDEAKCLFEQSGAAFARASPEEGRMLKHRAEEAQAQSQQLLLALLADFYAQRHVDYDRILIVYMRYPGTSILESQGAASLIGQPYKVQAQKLAEYQDEMQSFAAFLKEEYFSEGSYKD